MFERFTDRARRVVVLAQEEARLLDHNYIGTEHLLLGLVHEGEGIAARVLRTAGVDLDLLRAAVEDIIGRGDSTPSGHIPFTPSAKKVLELSLREALELGHNYIGTEHLLLGLIRQEDGVAAVTLAARGLDLERTRRQVVEITSGAKADVEPERLYATGQERRPFLLTAFTAVAREAKDRLHDDVGSEHVLLWLLSRQDSGAVRALEAEGVDLTALRSRLEQLLEEAHGTADPHEEAG